MIRNKIIIIAIVSLLACSCMMVAFAQTPPPLTPPYITTDKELYFYGDDIVFTIQLDEAPFGDPTMYAIGTVSQSTMIIGHTVQLEPDLSYTITHPTYSPDFTKHSVMPNDGLFTAHLTYNTFDPINGVGTEHLTTTFMYIEYEYDITDRFDVIESNMQGNFTSLQSQIDGIRNNLESISNNQLDFESRITALEDAGGVDLTLIENRLTALENAEGVDLTQIENEIQILNGTAQQHRTKIIQLTQDDLGQNSRMDEMENYYVGKINLLTQDDINQNIRIDGVESDLTNVNATLSNSINLLRTDFTHAKDDLYSITSGLETEIRSNNNDIMMMGLDVSSIMNDVDNGLWPRVNDLQTANTDMSRDIADNSRDIILLQTDVTNIIGVPSIPDQEYETLFELTDGNEWNHQRIEALRSISDDTNARHDADIISLQTRDQQIETKMFQEHNSVTQKFLEHDEQINLVNATATGNDIEIAKQGSKITRIFNDITSLRQEDQQLRNTFNNWQIHLDAHNSRLTSLEDFQRFADGRFTAIDHSIRDILNRIGDAGSYDVLDAEIGHIRVIVNDNVNEIAQLWVDMAKKQNILDAQ